MAELQKKATRESYGEALRDLADKYPELVVLDADLAAATKTGILRKLIRSVSSTAVLQKQT